MKGKTGEFGFEVIEENSFLPRSYFSYSSTLKINELELEPLSIDEAFERNDPALIIDSRVNTICSLIKELNVNNRYIKISDRFEECEALIPTFKPNLICFQMEVEPEDAQGDDRSRMNGPYSFNKLIQSVKSIADYNPFILVFSEESRSKAYQKAHSYEKNSSKSKTI